MKDLLDSTPARIGGGRSGTRPKLRDWLQFRADHAMARDAVHSEFSEEFLTWVRAQGFPFVQSSAVDKPDFISFPPKGKVANVEELQNIGGRTGRSAPTCDVQVVISDGLSAAAIEANVRDVLPMILDGLNQHGITCGVPVVVRYGRVAVGDQITHALGAKLSIILIGERPGLSAADSMSAYMTYNAGPNTISSDRTVVSNIHTRGTLPVEAGAYIVQLAKKIMDAKVSGVRLQQKL